MQSIKHKCNEKIKKIYDQDWTNGHIERSGWMEKHMPEEHTMRKWMKREIETAKDDMAQ